MGLSRDIRLDLIVYVDPQAYYRMPYSEKHRVAGLIGRINWKYRAGYNPELSYGSHIFQDLVEADILYTAVFENAHTLAWHPEKLMRLPNILKDLFPGEEKLEEIVRVCDVSALGCRVLHDLKEERTAVAISV